MKSERNNRNSKGLLILILVFLLVMLGLVIWAPFKNIGNNSGKENTPTPGGNTPGGSTPVAENSKEPSGTPVPLAPAEALEISEVMATNKTFPMNGLLCDWIELYNAGDSDIDLSNFYLSDKENKPMKSKLPSVVLAPKQYIVLTCDCEIAVAGSSEKVTVKGDLSFKLGGDGETVILTRADGLKIDSISYTELKSDYSFTKNGVSELPSPGFANTPEGNKMACEKLLAALPSATAPGLVINEILSSNSSLNKYTDSKKVSDFYDIVELYNASSEPILLSDYYLSDSAKALVSYRLPDVTLEAGKYYVIYCMGIAATNYATPTELFKVPESQIELSYFGETLYLTYKDGLICDCVTYPLMYDGISYGRNPEKTEEFVIQKNPSPGKANKAGEKEISASPVASVESGAFTTGFSFEFTSGGTIYYTTDCSAPTTSSKKWDGKPINISKTTTVRAICVDGNKARSFESTYTYFLESYDFTMDVLSISMTSSDWEALKKTTSKSKQCAISIALYKNNRNDNTLILDEEFATTAVMELSGASSLKADKQSYHVKFKSAYGPSKLKDKVFEDTDIAEFNSLTIRSGSQNNIRALVRDELFSSLLYAYYNTELLLHESYRPVNLYINNEYRGVYFIREHLDTSMIANHNGVEEEEVVYARNMSTASGNFKGGTAADKETLKKATDIIRNKDLSDDAVLEELCQYIDYDNMVLFWATELWSDDNDCHLRVYKVGDGKWKFALHDHDLCMTKGKYSTTYTNKYFVKIVVRNGTRQYYREDEKSWVTAGLYQIFFTNIIKSEKFRADVLAKIGELTKTAYSNEFATQYATEKLLNVIEHDMEYNCQVWGGKPLYPKTSSGTPQVTYSGWKSAKKGLLNRLGKAKEDVIAALKQFMNMTEEEEKLYFGS